MKDKKFKDDQREESKLSLIGTAEYISPEMISQGKCGTAGDLWALGNCCYILRVYSLSIFSRSYSLFRFNTALDYAEHR